MKFWKKWTKRKIKKIAKTVYDQKKYIKQLEKQVKQQTEARDGSL